MEAGGAAGRGGAAASVGDRARAAIRFMARVQLVLGFAMPAFALCIFTLQPQLKQQGGEADAVIMRTHGLLLLLSAGAHAAAATVGAFARKPSSLSWICTTFAHAVSLVTFFHLVRAFAYAAAVAVGSFPGNLHAHREFIAHDVLLFVPLLVFLVPAVGVLFTAVVAIAIHPHP